MTVRIQLVHRFLLQTICLYVIKPQRRSSQPCTFLFERKWRKPCIPSRLYCQPGRFPSTGTCMRSVHKLAFLMKQIGLAPNDQGGELCRTCLCSRQTCSLANRAAVAATTGYGCQPLRGTGNSSHNCQRYLPLLHTCWIACSGACNCLFEAELE